MVLSDNSILQCYNEYYVLRTPNTASRFQTPQSTVPAWGFINAVNNVRSGAIVWVNYSRNNFTGTLRKPLIVVEGYDVSSIAPGLQDNYSVVDLIAGLNNPFLAGYDFNQQLDDIAGYDLVFVDFADGAADIVLNAGAVQEVINRVNANKVNDNRFGNIRQQNVVMGLSMGGLCARYTLANMTKNFPATPTETRLLITHDSPHQGANVPLGLQYLIRMVGGAQLFGNNILDIYPEYNDAIGLLNAPATKQLLTYRCLTTNTFESNNFLGTTYRNMITFPTTGVQPTYRFIATSLGNECAKPVFNPYTQLLNVSLDGFVFYFPIISYRLRTIAETYSLPATGSTSKIARFKLSSKFKLFGFITISKDYYDNTAYAPGTQLAIDGVPGSVTEYASETVRSLNVFSPFPVIFGLLGYVSANTSGTPGNFTFVSTASALDAGPYTTPVFSQKYVNGINQNYPSTSETFIAQETNNSAGTSNNTHIRFTARNSRWLFNEMENMPNLENCSAECFNPYFISGNNTICTNESYFIPGLPRGSTVTWSSNIGIVTFNSTTANPVTVTQAGNGTIVLTATISNACGGNIFITKSGIVVGGPYAGFNITGYPYAEQSCYEVESINSFQATLSTGQSGTGWQWGYRILGVPGDIIYPYNTQYFTLIPDQPGTYEIFVRPTNTCGVGIPESVKPVTVSYGCFGRFKASPNPTNGEVQIEASDKKTVIQEIEIADKLGNVKKKIKFNADTKKTIISIAKLPADVYIIRIFDGKTWVSKKIIKN